MGNKLAVSEAVKTKLDELTKTLVDACGDNLVGVIVHGSAVRGGWREGTSDVDLVCVLADDSQKVLAKIGPALELARFSARIEMMILQRDEIERSADCFPLLYSDIARASATLTGKNPFESMIVPDHHKRLRIEQELREIRIRMRRVATDRAPARSGRGADSAFAGAIERKLKQARGALWALLERRGEKVDDGVDVVLAAACKAFGVDIKPLRRVREDPDEAYTALAKLLDAVLHEVDREDAKAAGAKAADAKSSDAQPGESKGDAKPSAAKADAKSSGAKPSDAKDDDGKGDAKDEHEAKASDDKGGESDNKREARATAEQARRHGKGPTAKRRMLKRDGGEAGK